MGTFSDSGYVRARLDEWVTTVRNLYYSIFGTNYDLSDDTQDGQLSGAFGEALSNQDQQVELISKVCDPAQAQGNYLSTLVTLNGITRNGATNSTVTLSLTGTDGTVIPAGSLVRETTNDEQFSTDNAVTISSGSATVTATAVNSGVIVASAGTVTTIDTQIAGWTAVTNDNDATEGQDEESDTDLRIRRANSTAISSTGNVESVAANLYAVDDVTSVIVNENKTSSTNSDGIPAHSIACIVEGGAASDIAESIFNTKSAGCNTFGDLTETISDSQGFDQDISYSRPDDVNIYIGMELRQLSDFPSTGEDDIKTAITDYFEEDEDTRLSIGDNVIFSEIYAPINTVSGVSIPRMTIAASDSEIDTYDSGTTYAADDLSFGSDGLIYQSQVGSNLGNDPTTDDGTNWLKTQDDITIAFDELGRFDETRITITQVV